MSSSHKAVCIIFSYKPTSPDHDCCLSCTGIVLYCIALYCVVLRSDIALWCCTPKAAKPIFITRLIKYYFLIQNTTIFYVHAVSHQLSDATLAILTSHQPFDIASSISCCIRHLTSQKAFRVMPNICCHVSCFLSQLWHQVFDGILGISCHTRHSMSPQALPEADCHFFQQAHHVKYDQYVILKTSVS